MSLSIYTMGSQLFNRVAQLFDIDSYFDNDHAFKEYLSQKRKHFDEYHVIKPQLQEKLRTWVRRIPGALIVAPEEMNQLMSASNTEQRHYSSHQLGTGYGFSYDHAERNEVTMQKKVRRNTPYNQFTNATCSYILPMGGGKVSLLFFTFDHEAIKSCSVIVSNKYSSGGMADSIDAVKIPEWDTVSQEEYNK